MAKLRLDGPHVLIWRQPKELFWKKMLQQKWNKIMKDMRIKRSLAINWVMTGMNPVTADKYNNTLGNDLQPVED